MRRLQGSVTPHPNPPPQGGRERLAPFAALGASSVIRMPLGALARFTSYSYATLPDSRSFKLSLAYPDAFFWSIGDGRSLQVMADSREPIAVLTSGGVDSAILVAESTATHSAVHPLYIRTGLAWEKVELEHLHRFLAAIARPALKPLQVLDLPVADLYGQHWSITGSEVPDADSPDEAVYLPGRNVLLLAKAMIWCRLHKVGLLAMGLLKSNPFPDATPEFFAAYESSVNLATGGHVHLLRPYVDLTKRQVLERARELPLEWTFSCIQPVAGRHCGRCNKCAERRRAFAEAGLTDRTVYDTEGPCIA